MSKEEILETLGEAGLNAFSILETIPEHSVGKSIIAREWVTDTGITVTSYEYLHRKGSYPDYILSTRKFGSSGDTLEEAAIKLRESLLLEIVRLREYLR